MAISEEKLQLYIVAIVGVVAAVGILVLLMNTGAVSGETDDLTGQVVSTCCAGHNDNNGNFVCEHRWSDKDGFCARQKLAQ